MIRALSSAAVVLAAALVLGGCPKQSDKKPVEPVPAKRDAGTGMTPPSDDAAVAIVLPPAPPLPSLPAGLPPLPAMPGVTPEAVALGELLFHDRRLSASGALACASCHDPARGYAGGSSTTAEGKPNLRRVPTLVNLAWVKELGWDGRYPSIGELLPSHLRGQLGRTADEIAGWLADVPVYRAHLARVGGAPADAALAALAAFVLTRYEGGAPWDLVEEGARVPRPGAKPDPVLAGYLVFTGAGQCAVCHPPPLYTDGGFHRVTASQVEDPGRGLVDPKLAGAFRTPTLRGAAARGAFMHTGAHATLEQVLADYHKYGANPNPNPAAHEPRLPRLDLAGRSQEDLLAFLRALTARRPAPPVPALP